MDIDKLINIADKYFISENDTVKAYEAYKKALDIDNDNGYIIQQLGCCYEKGFGVEKNIELAKQFYEKASEKGMTGSCWQLARIYEEEKNEQCIKWLEKAHELGDIVASFYLYLLFAKGEIVKQNKEEAEKWLHLSCAESNEMALYEMAQRYIDKESAAFDEEKYIEYLTKSADLDYLPACEELSNYYKGQMHTDIDKVVKYAKKCAELGKPYVLYIVGCDYRLGYQYVGKDDALALKYFEQAGELGSGDACIEAANYYEEGIACEKNLSTALCWYKKALMLNLSCSGDILKLFMQLYDEKTAEVKFMDLMLDCSEKGCGAAMFGIYCYLDSKNADEAHILTWLDNAAKTGYSLALYNCGKIRGRKIYSSVDVNEREAFQYFMAAYKAGYMPATDAIGNYYLFGKGVEQNTDLAIEWYQAGANAGLVSSYCNLGNVYFESQYGRVDYAKSLDYYEKGYQKHQGKESAFCAYRLATAYFNGMGVKKDLQKAFKLAYEANEAGIEYADVLLDNIGNHLRCEEQTDNILEDGKTLPQAQENREETEKITKEISLSYVYCFAVSTYEDLLTDDGGAINWMQDDIVNKKTTLVFTGSYFGFQFIDTNSEDTGSLKSTVKDEMYCGLEESGYSSWPDNDYIIAFGNMVVNELEKKFDYLIFTNRKFCDDSLCYTIDVYLKDSFKKNENEYDFFADSMSKTFIS